MISTIVEVKRSYLVVSPLARYKMENTPWQGKKNVANKLPL